MVSAREAVLGRVRAALRDVPAGERHADVVVDRSYRFHDASPHTEQVDRFAERVAEYKAVVHRVEADAVCGALTEACARREVRRLVVPTGLPEAWRPEGVELLADDDLGYDVLDAVDGTLTGCALGIAETGTIVLTGDEGQGRRAITLVPDYHLCVVGEDQVVGSVPEAVAALADAAVAGRAITFISGPSATSDIELERVEGVHGSRNLEVLVVARPSRP